jgi:hypothetical protein
MKSALAVALAAVLLLCAGCAQYGGGPSASGGGSITMYGTIDTGVTVHN